MKTTSSDQPTTPDNVLAFRSRSDASPARASEAYGDVVDIAQPASDPRMYEAAVGTVCAAFISAWGLVSQCDREQLLHEVETQIRIHAASCG